MTNGRYGMSARDLIEWHARFRFADIARIALVGVGMSVAGTLIHGLADFVVDAGSHPQDVQAVENVGIALTGSGGIAIALCTVAASWVLVSRLTLRLWK